MWIKIKILTDVFHLRGYPGHIGAIYKVKIVEYLGGRFLLDFRLMNNDGSYCSIAQTCLKKDFEEVL